MLMPVTFGRLAAAVAGDDWPNSPLTGLASPLPRITAAGSRLMDRKDQATVGLAIAARTALTSRHAASILNQVEIRMFDRFDRNVHRTLRKLAKQRVRLILQPGDYWVIDSAIPQDDDAQAALLTCQMRGWIEPLHHAVPSAQLTKEGSLPRNINFEKP